MAYLRKLEDITLYSIIFLISLQLGKHFWPISAFFQGIRIDYLSPTLYLSDIFIIIFILTRLILDIKSFKGFISGSFIFPFFLISIFISTFMAQSFNAAAYWNLKIVEMIFLGWAIYSFKFNRQKLYKVFDVVIFAAALQSVIALLQFFMQRSINGPLYFLGERSFNVDTIGIATFFSNGQEFIRAYGTFPHPNVLAFFLAISIVFCVFVISLEKNTRSLIYSMLSIIIFLGLLSTASRTIIIATIIASFFIFSRSKKSFYYSIALLSIFFPTYLLIFSGRFLTLGPLIDALGIRMELALESIRIIYENLLFGVGPNNTFLAAMSNSVPLYVRFQPVHNIYLHIIAQIGFFGSIFALAFLIKVFKKIKKAFKLKKSFLFPIAILTLEAMIVGLFDHFLITLQQGMIMSALLLGLLFNKTMESS